MLKALREAKVHTSWINPYPAYDEAVQHYVAQVLDASTNAAFLDDFRALQRRTDLPENKGDLIEHYASIAPVLLPHLHDRPLTLERYLSEKALAKSGS